MNCISLKADMANLPIFLEFLNQFISKRPFPSNRIKELEIAAEEALVNIIRYAYPEGEPGDVHLSLAEKDGQRIEIEFRDSGIPFDPTSRKEPDIRLAISEREIGGLGILLIKRIADGISYRREAGQNILTLSADAPEGNQKG
ncbi:MAG: ATP-binding protein [Desulfobacteraceae bacterium]|jgi:anti-sigma regulatory factor (Ser/Thr protein kinase)|nr:MAG: ATP-binding protein [Desulfobacteraceae bacterium]